MAASERARELTDALVKGAIYGAIYREHDKREDARAALLAYVADLEAVADKALTLNPFSIAHGGKWLDQHIRKLSELQTMAAEALDRPEE